MCDRGLEPTSRESEKGLRDPPKLAAQTAQLILGICRSRDQKTALWGASRLRLYQPYRRRGNT